MGRGGPAARTAWLASPGAVLLPGCGDHTGTEQKPNPMGQKIQRDVPNTPRPLHNAERSRQLRGWKRQSQRGTGGCAIPRAALHSSVEKELNNSAKPWARGSCHGYGTPGHRFPAEQPFLRGQIEVHNINVVYAQTTAHKSQVTASSISATSLP